FKKFKTGSGSQLLHSIFYILHFLFAGSFKRPIINSFYKFNKPGEIMLLVIPISTMASIRAIQIISLLHLRAHPFHIFWVHGIELCANSERWHFYLGEVFGPVPIY